MATTQELLDQANDAYHRLMTGAAVVEVTDQNGERVRYQPSNAYRLAAYINTLERKLATEPQGPMQVIF